LRTEATVAAAIALGLPFATEAAGGLPATGAVRLGWDLAAVAIDFCLPTDLEALDRNIDLAFVAATLACPRFFVALDAETDAFVFTIRILSYRQIFQPTGLRPAAA
jgi:hypothetical protein